jgi:hypothetical protein
MDCAQLIAAAQDALGGLERIRSVRTYHAVFNRTHDHGEVETVSVWRAAGGRIRVERRVGDRVDVRVANGSAGTLDDADRSELLRDARIAPRNMLAHAAEHRLALRSRPAPDGSRIVSFPAELVIYLFDSKSFLCSGVVDLGRHRRAELADYRTVDGIRTPFVERHTLTGRAFRDVYSEVAFNRELSDDLFVTS